MLKFDDKLFGSKKSNITSLHIPCMTLHAILIRLTGLFNKMHCPYSSVLNNGILNFLNAGVINVLNNGILNVLNAGVINVLNNGIIIFLNAGIINVLYTGVLIFLNTGVLNVLNTSVLKVLNAGVIIAYKLALFLFSVPVTLIIHSVKEGEEWLSGALLSINEIYSAYKQVSIKALNVFSVAL